MTRHNHFHRPAVGYPSAGGFTLLEVLITLVILSIGLVSIAALQAQLLRDSYSSLQRTVVSVQASDLVERLWAGRCDSTNFPDEIFSAWRNESAGSPLFQGWTVDPDSSLGAGPEYEIQISWDDSRASRDNRDAPTVQQVRANFDFWFRIPTDDCTTSP